MSGIAVSTLEAGSSTIPPVETVLRKSGVNVANATTTTIRWPGGWVKALEVLGEPAGGYSAFVRNVLWPILTGRLRIVLDENGDVSAVEGRDKDGNRVRILTDESVRPLVAAAEGVERPVKQGRPKLSATEKLMRQLTKAAEAEGVPIADLTARLEEQQRAGRKKRRKA